MAAINCDECNKEKCPQRSVGAICSLNKDTVGLVKTFESRDPILVARKLALVLQSEANRYEQALRHEEIGKEEDTVIYNRKGEAIDVVKKKKGIDGKISNLALNIMKGGKLINDIVNPPKVNPLFQQNNQYNISLNAVDEISRLSEEDQANTLKFIDDKLDANRKN